MNAPQNQAAGTTTAQPGGPPTSAASRTAGHRLEHLFRHIRHTASGDALLNLMKRYRGAGDQEPRIDQPGKVAQPTHAETMRATLSMPDLLQGIHRLPSLPSVVMELLASLDQEDADVDALSRTISRDQALTAKMLRLANSSFYGRARQVTSVAEAVAVLGFRTVRSVATTLGLMQTMGNGAPSAASLLPYWRHAIAVAVCARELAGCMQVNPDHAYTAGLLHDIGRLVLATQFRASLDAAIAYRAAVDCSMLAAERLVLDLDHAAVGAALANYWKFPLAMQHAVARHHAQADLEPEPLAAVVTLADALVHALDTAQDPDDTVPDIAAGAWRMLPPQDSSMLQLFGSVEKQLILAVHIANDQGV